MDVKTSTKISFYIGGFAELPINTKKNLFLRAELLYAQNGANIDKTKEDDNYNSGDYTISYNTNGGKYTVEQLNMPVLLKYVTKEKIAILGGCYIGTILSAKAINNNGATNDFTQEMKKFDFGLALGISYQIKKKIAIALRYNRGLINLDPTEENNAYYQFKGHYYNRTIHIGLEYLLN
jgi:opacity protein-like surface antigen